LLSNAFKFTHTGSVILRVDASGSTRSGDAADRDGQTSPSLHLRFSVQDTGIGIALGDMAHVFEPFVQLEDGKAQQGTGLGLAISQQQVNLLGGRLELESVVGKGSTFHFEIPVTLGQADEAASIPRQTLESIPGSLSADSASSHPQISENTASALPHEWKEQMRQAILEADVVNMQKLIHEIEAEFPDFSKRLAQLVYDFDYDGIRALIDVP
jgi:hypothetical protein